MKNLSFSIYNIIALMSIFVLMILILLPFSLINMEQAERIAKWKSVYEDLNYIFDLVNLHEKTIIPQMDSEGKIVTEDTVNNRIIPYLNLKSTEYIAPYKYRTMNGRPVRKYNQFYFDKLLERKDGVIIGIKENLNQRNLKDEPLYYLFVDINGKKKPNRIGRDIFIMNIFRNKISALGEDEPLSALKVDCSPIGSGFFCSKYYLLGGKF